MPNPATIITVTKDSKNRIAPPYLTKEFAINHNTVTPTAMELKIRVNCCASVEFIPANFMKIHHRMFTMAKGTRIHKTRRL